MFDVPPEARPDPDKHNWVCVKCGSPGTAEYMVLGNYAFGSCAAGHRGTLLDGDYQDWLRLEAQRKEMAEQEKRRLKAKPARKRTIF